MTEADRLRTIDLVVLAGCGLVFLVYLIEALLDPLSLSGYMPVMPPAIRDIMHGDRSQNDSVAGVSGSVEGILTFGRAAEVRYAMFTALTLEVMTCVIVHTLDLAMLCCCLFSRCFMIFLTVLFISAALFELYLAESLRRSELEQNAIQSLMLEYAHDFNSFVTEIQGEARLRNQSSHNHIPFFLPTMQLDNNCCGSSLYNWSDILFNDLSHPLSCCNQTFLKDLDFNSEFMRELRLYCLDLRDRDYLPFELHECYRDGAKVGGPCDALLEGWAWGRTRVWVTVHPLLAIVHAVCAATLYGLTPAPTGPRYYGFN